MLRTSTHTGHQNLRDTIQNIVLVGLYISPMYRVCPLVCWNYGNSIFCLNLLNLHVLNLTSFV